MKQVAIFGGSGQLGQKVIKHLISAGHNVTSFERREKPSAYGESKSLIDFGNINSSSFNGDTVIVTIGTTQARAGSEDAFVAVDYELVSKIGVWAKQQGVREFHVISSIGSEENARGLYLQTKWKMEQRISELNFDKLFIYRPSVYSDLDRKPFRLKEVSSIPFLGFFASLAKSTLKYRPINTGVIASKIVQSVDSELVGKTIFEGDEIYSAAAISFNTYRKKEQKLLVAGVLSLLVVLGLTAALGFGSLLVTVLVGALITALLFLWVKSFVTLKNGALNNLQEANKNTKTKKFLRFLIRAEVLLILGALLFGYFTIAIPVLTLLIFDVLFFFNTEDYLNSVR